MSLAVASYAWQDIYLHVDMALEHAVCDHMTKQPARPGSNGDSKCC